MIYGLRAKDIPRHLLEKIEIYIYVQAHTINDQPAMEDRFMAPRKEPTLQETASGDDGIMAQQNTNHDNAGAEARHPDDTPGGVQ